MQCSRKESSDNCEKRNRKVKEGVLILPKGAFHIKTKRTSHFSFPFESSSAYFQNSGRLFICGGTHFEGDDYI